jgi:hypothetical protein
VDVKRAADLYNQRNSLRQIGAELEVPWTTVSHQLRSAGFTMRRGAPAHPASTQHIVELRDQGLTWNEVAKGGRYDGFRRLDLVPEGPWDGQDGRMLMTREITTTRTASEIIDWIAISPLTR